MKDTIIGMPCIQVERASTPEPAPESEPFPLYNRKASGMRIRRVYIPRRAQLPAGEAWAHGFAVCAVMAATAAILRIVLPLIH